MFTGNFKESSVKEITINKIEPNSLELLIDYMYPSVTKCNRHFSISKQSVWLSA